MKKKGEVVCRECGKNIHKESAIRSKLRYMCAEGCIDMFIDKHVAKAKDRKRIEKKKKGKKKSDLTLTQEVFNRYIRARDAFPIGKCIYCGKDARYGDSNVHACHFYSRGARSDLRFCEKNVFAGHGHCNLYADAELNKDFAKNVAERIGQKEFDKLSIRVNQDYSKEKLKELRTKYAKKTRELGC